MRTVVIIPVYQKKLSEYEMCSIFQCKKKLFNHEIIIIKPQSLNLNSYSLFEGMQMYSVPDAFMDSIPSYSKMLCSVAFYETFSKYDYMLIYQTDAFVFEDRIDYFCNLGFDYYGAPWLNEAFIEGKYYCVGNGGLSLRKISSCINILKREQYNGESEDFFWVKNDCKEFVVAPMDIALQFSFQSDVKRCYVMNNCNLPMGCHAWWKHDYNFFSSYFEQEGYHFKEIEDVYEGAFKHWIGWNLDKSVLSEIVELQFCEEKLYIWGTKLEGIESGYLLKKIGKEFEYIDSNSIMQGRELWGKKIISPEEFQEKRDKQSVIIVATKFRDNEVAQILKNYGITTDRIIFYKNLVYKIEKYIDKCHELGIKSTEM